MTLPRLSNTDRWRFKDMKLEASQVLLPGKVMYCRGRKILGYDTIDKLGNVFAIPRDTDTLSVSKDDYPQVKEWIG